MAVKTYVPSLRIVLRQAYRYGVRWQPKLAKVLTEPQLTCLASTMQAILDCLVLLGDETVGG